MRKTVAILIAALLLVLCSCGKETASSISSSPKIEVSSKADDTLDPQNRETENEGSPVKIEEIKPQTGKALGIDVSKWQGKINWQSVKKSGIEFAVIRIGYRAENGLIYKDSNADYNIQQAEKNGLLIGVYFFSTAVNTAEAIEEAEWTAQMIKGYPISYPVVYDCEGFLNSDSRMAALTASRRTENALAFLEKIKNIGYEGMFYSSKTDLHTNWNTAEIEKNYKIWIAHYPEVTYPQLQNPDYSGKYSMWQYTNKGKVSGIKGNCDMVVSYFEAVAAKPKADIKVDEATAPTEMDNIYTAVNETVTAKELVNLREGAGTNFNKVGSLKNGDTLTRTAIGSNGWSKLLQGGKTVYAISSYLTTDLSFKPVVTEPPVTDSVYTTVNETVTAKEFVNLREGAGTSYNIVGSLKNGETVTRTGIGSNNWSRLLYNGQTVYALTQYITTDLNYKPPKSEEPQMVNGYEFTQASGNVTAKSETNLRSFPTTVAGKSEVVYTLKNGEYIERTGVSVNGWTRLLYNGQTVYAISSYLTE